MNQRTWRNIFSFSLYNFSLLTVDNNHLNIFKILLFFLTFLNYITVFILHFLFLIKKNILCVYTSIENQIINTLSNKLSTNINKYRRKKKEKQHQQQQHPKKTYLHHIVKKRRLLNKWSFGQHRSSSSSDEVSHLLCHILPLLPSKVLPIDRPCRGRATFRAIYGCATHLPLVFTSAITGWFTSQPR